MINLMYLVLTALLALNVSAEVMNAFFTINEGINNSNQIVEQSNGALLNSIQDQAEAYDSDENQQYLAQAREVKSISDSLVAYVGELSDDLFEAAGGPSEDDPTKPVRYKDKDITTRMLVEGMEGEQGKGYDLKERIERSRAALLDIVGNNPGLAESLPLGIDSATIVRNNRKDWVEVNFFQMPVAAVFPILTKIQNDAKSSSNMILNDLLGKVSGAEAIKFDAFQVVNSTNKGYIIRGEAYTADIFLSAFSTTAGENTRISVDGNNLPVSEGKATYTARPTTIGTKSYTATITLTNPLTGESERYQKTFEYEVGERSVAVSADKMNVFYIGVDNPITVSAAGVSSNEVNVSISGGGGTLSKVDNDSYNVTVKQPGEATISVSGGGLDPTPYTFRVKRIPDPTARVGNLEDGGVGNGEFKAQRGVIAWLDDFDFDARCDIAGFELVYVASRQDPVPVANQGGSFNERSRNLVQRAKPGDTYYFNNVRAICPGDAATRKVNSMVFQIR